MADRIPRMLKCRSSVAVHRCLTLRGSAPLLAVLALSALASCGQKGPLKLPEAATASTAASAPPPSSIVSPYPAR